MNWYLRDGQDRAEARRLSRVLPAITHALVSFERIEDSARIVHHPTATSATSTVAVLTVEP